MDQPLGLSCKMPGVEPADVKLFYRNSGQEHFTPVTMQRQGDAYRGSVPSQYVIGKALQYYIEARDEAGKAGGEAAGVVFVLLAVAVAWGASAVVLHLLLRTSWGVSLGAAPLLLVVATIMRNAVRFRRRRRLRTEQSS